MNADVVLFTALLTIAAAIAGASAFVIFWPLTLVHIRDRHPQITAVLGTEAFLKPRALAWLLRGEYRNTPDPNLSGLAAPARIALLVILAGLLLGGLLWLVAVVLK